MSTSDCFVVFGPLLALVAVMLVCFGYFAAQQHAGVIRSRSGE